MGLSDGQVLYANMKSVACYSKENLLRKRMQQNLRCCLLFFLFIFLFFNKYLC